MQSNGNVLRLYRACGFDHRDGIIVVCIGSDRRKLYLRHHVKMVKVKGVSERIQQEFKIILLYKLLGLTRVLSSVKTNIEKHR